MCAINENYSQLNRKMKAVDDDLSELNALQELTKSKSDCFTRELTQMNDEIDEFSTFSNESGVLDLAEKYRWILRLT